MRELSDEKILSQEKKVGMRDKGNKMVIIIIKLTYLNARPVFSPALHCKRGFLPRLGHFSGPFLGLIATESVVDKSLCVCG